MNAEKLRVYLRGMGVYPSQAGIESMRAPGERALTEAVLRQAVALLSDGDLFCLYILAEILTGRQVSFETWDESTTNLQRTYNEPVTEKGGG